ncbi:hypothetical protein [Tolypothrix sp. VBCCA 56010]|uniref:hypothetical protein n=1 Tax=Tolypothrix sp. VBCCA 56010 TaxID=3137731 RepID=UPI003D7EB9FF
MRVLIDTNIVLDFLLQREPFLEDAHTRSVEQARQAILETLTVMVICPVNRAIVESAFTSGRDDE